MNNQDWKIDNKANEAEIQETITRKWEYDRNEADGYVFPRVFISAVSVKLTMAREFSLSRIISGTYLIHVVLLQNVLMSIAQRYQLGVEMMFLCNRSLGN